MIRERETERVGPYPLASIVLPLVLNKAGYTATLVACGWAGAVLEVTKASWQDVCSISSKT